MIQYVYDLLLRVDAVVCGTPWFVFILLGTGLFFTVYLRFPQIRFFRHAVDIMRGKHETEGAVGDASHFQALATALSGTVGTGNIAGVALAIHLGGPAALFWMVVTAIIGMTTKFVEVSLSHKYRDCLSDGTVAGGPMYFMAKRLNVRLSGGRVIRTGVWMASLFAFCTILCSFGTGCLPQINSISAGMADSFGINKMLTGAVLTLVMGAVIVGGIRRIVKVTGRLVPIMGLLYFAGTIVVAVCNYENLIPGFVSIFTSAFTGSAAVGGFLGASVSFAMIRGVNRGIYSNEAGQGSAPIAHAAARASEPVSEGLVSLLEPFIDTVIICMLTGTTIIASGVWKQKYQTDFQMADTMVLSGVDYDDTTDEGRARLRSIVDGERGASDCLFSGAMQVDSGRIVSGQTLMHSHSLAEDVRISLGGRPFTGTLAVDAGKPDCRTDGGRVVISGRSLLHSVPLTIRAFSSSCFGGYGQYIVTLSLLLFAFTTAISWSYYGDRAVAFLFGLRYVKAFKFVYLGGFFIGSFIDTSIVWVFSSIAIVFMSVPNLVGLLLLHREVRNELTSYEHNLKRRGAGGR